MMETLLSIVSIFVIPFVGLSISYRINGYEFDNAGKLLVRYMTLTAVNYVVDGALLSIAGLEIFAYSFVYSLISLITASAIPYMALLLGRYISARLEISKK